MQRKSRAPLTAQATFGTTAALIMLSKAHKTVQLTKEQAQEQRKWYIVDLSNLILGRAATQIARLLRGKHKATFTPHVDSGDFVVVINAAQVQLTGNKASGKLYRTHTLYPGGVRTRSAEEMRTNYTEEMIRKAVWGMLPKGPLGRDIIKKLKIYPTAEHPHEAQQPTPYKLLSMRD